MRDESQHQFRPSAAAGPGPVPGCPHSEDRKVVGEGGSEDRGGRRGGSGQIEEVDSLSGLGKPASSAANLQHPGGRPTARANLQHPTRTSTCPNVEHPSRSTTRPDPQHPACPLANPDSERDPAADPTCPGLFEGGPTAPATLPTCPDQREHHPTSQGGENRETIGRGRDPEGEDREA